MFILNPNNKKGNCEHIDTEWKILEEATCEKVGSKQLYCKECGKIITTARIEKTIHNEVIDSGYLPTCEEDGLTEGSHCSVCNLIIVKQEIISKTGHNYKLNPELSNIEKLVYECRCGDSYEIENDGTIICEDHTNTKWEIIEEATCNKLGKKELKCQICFIVLETASIEMTEHEIIIDKAVLPGCETEGLTEGSHCDKCKAIIKKQEKVDSTGHNYIITKTVSPIEKEDGYIEYTCSNCNDSYQEIIKNTGNYNPTLPITIILNDTGIIVTNNNGGVNIDGNKVTINLSGEYNITGTLSEGSINIALAEEEKAKINLQNINITSTISHPIYVISGDKVDISSNSGTVNYIYDKRPTTTSDAVGGAIYSDIDLDIQGRGELYIESTYNNGIASTKDLNIKNLTLKVNAPNNAIKGNDSLTIESGNITAISSSGDALKTENSDISEKGNQRGIIHIIDGTLNLFAACDAIDASFDVIIDGGNINIYTEKYSSYSGDVSITTSKTLYLRVSRNTGINNSNYTYVAKFINEDNTSKSVTGTVLSNMQSKYYKFDIPSDAKYVKIYGYNSSQTIGSITDYSCYTDQLTIPSSYDTYYVTSLSNKKLSGSWQNYSSSQGGGRPGGMGPGGMQEGNPDSALYSCKGIKADNSITINGGNINIKSHDDAIHTNSDVLLETNNYGIASITINGGNINITTDDDGIHADGSLNINGGNIIINDSYEGIEGNYIYFNGGTTQLKSSDDGINAKTTLYFKDGIVYLDANGDGIDSNGNVYMSGGIVLAIGPSNGGNGVIDIGDRGYTFSFTGGLLLAIGASGMDVSPTAGSGNTSTSGRVTSSQNSYLTVTSNGEIIAVLKVNKANQTYRVFAYHNSKYPQTTITSSTSTSVELVNDLYFVKNS